MIPAPYVFPVNLKREISVRLRALEDAFSTEGNHGIFLLSSSASTPLLSFCVDPATKLASLAPYISEVYRDKDVLLRKFQRGKKSKYVIGFFEVSGVARVDVLRSTPNLALPLLHLSLHEEGNAPLDMATSRYWSLGHRAIWAHPLHPIFRQQYVDRTF